MEAKKIAQMQKDVIELSGDFEYYDMFSYNRDFGEILDTILSAEADEVSFCVMNFVNDEVNGGVVFMPGDDQYARMPKVKDAYFVVALNNVIKAISEKRFNSRKHLEATLRRLAIGTAKCNGIISPEIFPYPSLQEFFYLLNVWRSSNGRATLDDKVICDALNQVYADMSVSAGR